MRAFIEPLLELESYQKVLNSIKMKNTPVLATGVIEVQQTQMMYAISTHLKRPMMIITHNETRAKEIYDDMCFFSKNTMYYPSKDILFYNADVHSSEIIRKRFMVMNTLLHNETPTIVLSIESLLDRLLPASAFKKYIITLEDGQIVNRDSLISKLIFMGYERHDLVEGSGQFALRGGILDIFSPTADNAVRIEFWDDEIDSIRSLDSNSQRSIEKEESVEIFPVRELVYEESDVPKVISLIKKEYEKTIISFDKNGFAEEKKRLVEYVGEIIEKLTEEKTFHGISTFISYFYDKTVSLLDYLNEDTLLFFDEPKRIREHVDSLFFEYEESMKSRIEKGAILAKQSHFLLSYDEILAHAQKKEQILLTTITQNMPDFTLKEMVSFTVKSTPAFQKRLDLFCEELLQLKKEHYRIIILAGGKTRCERFVSELYERKIESSYVSDLSETVPEKGTIIISSGRLSRGFSYAFINFAVFSDRELLGENSKKSLKKKKKKGAAIESFTDLKIGDYVVHDNHGIGVFGGLEKINVEGFNKDYMKISYSDGGSLFVPVAQMNMIQKYIGSSDSAPKINKLGGQEWIKAKTKTRIAVKILAEDLVALYAKRQSAVGFAYSSDTLWQKEFEEDFSFEETDDQLSAIEDVKKDMESTKVMDRLICGDVGYGKTEVAIRAAFKAVQDGKQVAYLVPTTILAQQHYNTFVQRMADYPIKTELMSRFRTPKQQKSSIESLGKGFSDIVIGTHRILSKDMQFKNLGLVIIDEEQRFGVSHKEKLRALRTNLDVLTLTATPIPRTLHMSLSGIRDMSILEEPPLERHPIQTYVMESSPEFIREAILRELHRGGQVFYLYNRVETISEEAFKVQKLVPEAKISFAHGKMTERELERIMEEFIEGEIDVLVCTTIIETGLDISNANTIIIQDADRMGLSQLYQLRGRVGRSNKIAYAYLCYRKNKVLQEVAEKRLQTIKEFTEFGSGFKIAMRDLEIRGAGNLLGAEQHGHMESVGYDMYCRLLEEEVATLKGEIPKEKFETTIDININAYIPEFYIKNQEQRLEMYKKIATITNEKEYYDIQEEMEDRFGNLPVSVQTLLEVVLLKSSAHDFYILSITQKQDSLIITFKSDAQIDPEKLTRLIMSNKTQYFFTSGTVPYITVKFKKNDKLTPMEYIKSILHELTV